MNEKIVYAGSASPGCAVNCILAGVTYPNPDYKVFRTESDVYLFEYITKGKGYIEINNTKHPASEGDFCFTGKGQKACYSADPMEPYEKMWLCLDGTMVDDLVKMFKLSDFSVFSVNVHRYFLEIQDLLVQLKNENSGSIHRRIACLLFEMFTELKCSEFFVPEKQKISTAESIRNYIDSNIYSSISLDMMTERFGITKMHIIRVFKKEYGTTPMQYLIDRKINIAKSLLAGTIMPIIK